MEKRVLQHPRFKAWFGELDIVVLLGGGSKRTQKRDIKAAKALAKELEN